MYVCHMFTQEFSDQDNNMLAVILAKCVTGSTLNPDNSLLTHLNS